ncbi:MAG: 4Fe-4S cluster-binding domain-containing protein [Lentisphaeria bacterium]|nr:4Fe-4S cluster-binding domain-containing protein [Lentisphaeria bacterium]
MQPRYDRGELLALRRRPGLMHPLFGDLLDPSAVVYPEPTVAEETLSEHSPYMVHVSVTGRCNARCRGCVNSAITLLGAGQLPADVVPERDSRAIANLLEGVEERDIVVCLYGGEPLLAPEKIRGLMAGLERRLADRSVRYMLYTNGQLLDRTLDLARDVLSRVWLLSVSIDGQSAQHQDVRPGTDLATIERGLERFRAVRGDGCVLMWSTLREQQSLTDCYEEFLRLRSLGMADQFFWHWVETAEPFADLAGYAQRYEEEYGRVLADASAWLGRGTVPPIPHLCELLLYLLTGRQRGMSACGVEVARNYDILGGGIHACADLPPEWAIGSIAEDGTPTVRQADLGRLVTYKEDLGCAQCGVHGYCGGRCPVQGVTAQAQRLLEYCQLMRLHVGLACQALPRIREAMGRGAVDPGQLYEQSAFYAQFTDVTP